MKRQVPAIITTVTGTIVFLSIILFKTDAAGWPGQFDRMRQFMAAVMMFMGMANMMRVHGSVIRKKDRNWMFSAWLLVIMFAYAIFGMAVGNKNETYRWFYNAFIPPINSTMYAMVAFYLTSASYKAFRAKTLDAALMMACAVWVMLSNVPVGDMLWSSESWLGGMAGVRDWIVSVPNSAVSRGIAVGSFLGGFATQLRVFLGIERRHLGQG